jgi:hypothetical protein
MKKTAEEKSDGTAPVLTPMPPEIAAAVLPVSPVAAGPVTSMQPQASQIIGRPPGSLAQAASAARVEVAMANHQPREVGALFKQPGPMEMMLRGRVEQFRVTLGQLVEQSDRLAVAARAQLSEIERSQGGADMASKEGLALDKCSQFLTALEDVLEAFAPKPAPAEAV